MTLERLRDGTPYFNSAKLGLKENEEHARKKLVVYRILFESIFNKHGCTTVLTSASKKQLHKETQITHASYILKQEVPIITIALFAITTDFWLDDNCKLNPSSCKQQ